jgi:hypothetical protein
VFEDMARQVYVNKFKYGDGIKMLVVVFN